MEAWRRALDEPVRAFPVELAGLGPEALGLGADALGEILASESRRLHSLLRDQRAIAGIGRAWANEILHHAKLSPFALSRDLAPEEVDRLAEAIDAELSRGLELRERGAADKRVYRVHRKLGEPCYVCGAPIARVDYEEHTVYYCPDCQTGGRVLKDRRPSELLKKARSLKTSTPATAARARGWRKRRSPTPSKPRRLV